LIEKQQLTAGKSQCFLRYQCTSIDFPRRGNCQQGIGYTTPLPIAYGGTPANKGLSAPPNLVLKARKLRKLLEWNRSIAKPIRDIVDEIDYAKHYRRAGKIQGKIQDKLQAKLVNFAKEGNQAET